MEKWKLITLNCHHTAILIIREQNNVSLKIRNFDIDIISLN
jgi:hypothetical protein